MSDAPKRKRAQRLRIAQPVEAADAASLTTETLLGLVARGHQGAFAALYDRFAPRVFGLVRRILRDPAQSEEVMQEVLLEVWRLAPRFDATEGKGCSWIIMLAHRRAVDRVRSEQATRDRHERVAEPVTGPLFDQVADEVEGRLERERVNAALGQLTALQREAIELAFFGGYNYREVAQLLNTPLGTVKTRMRDGLIRLRDELGGTS